MKVYIPKVKESWIIDRIRKEWYGHSDKISTNFKFFSNIIWINAPWAWSKVNKYYLNNKIVICTIHHIEKDQNSEKFKQEFNELDKFVNYYHVPSLNSLNQLKLLTDKKIFHIPYWVNNSKFFYIDDKNKLRDKYSIGKNDWLVGSFQRDTEGSDLKSPKLIKGPDIFIKNIINLYENNKNLKVILTGKRRQYVIENLKKHNIPFTYFEMVNAKELNELYNILNLYIVSSRIEGGPQAILECAITKTPIISTNVGLAKEILHESSIYIDDIALAKPDLDYAYQNAVKLEIKNLIKEYEKMFYQVYQTT